MVLHAYARTMVVGTYFPYVGELVVGFGNVGPSGQRRGAFEPCFDFVVLSDFIGTAQRVHLAASHWLYVLLALHIGLHGQLLAGAFKRRAHAPHGAAVAALLRLVGAVFALYGLTAFVARDFLDAMFLRVHFFLGDASESALAFYVDYAAIMVCFALAAYGFVRLVRRLARG